MVRRNTEERVQDQPKTTDDSNNRHNVDECMCKGIKRSPNYSLHEYNILLLITFGELLA